MGFIVSYEYLSRREQTEQLRQFAGLMSSYLWNLNRDDAEAGLELIVSSRGYHSAGIVDSFGDEFVSVTNPHALASYEVWLKHIWIVRTVRLEAPVNHEGAPIGRMLVFQVNRNVYIYLNGLIIAILLGGFVSYYFRVVDSRRALAQKNQDLRTEIAERKRAMELVQRLKVQQDGDYFLMTLLTEPLGGNHAHGDKVKVDMLVKMKKEFVFRKWHMEIGGDMCIAHTLRLRGRTYTVFVNADAMGKSMQGAGGIIVFGSVFKTLIDRTHQSPQVQETFPEQWLKHAFVELNNVFESFDGSMLVSCVLGLVDEETGLFTFINAEHPFPVLYRNGAASFIEEELAFRKLGFLRSQREIFVRTFQLETGDVVILGSDGRDDIVTGHSEIGQIMNEDEHMFLRHVVEGEGKLPKIYELVRNMGEIVDDLSLLRVEYAGTPLAANVEGEALQGMARARRLYKEEEYEECLQLLEDLVWRFPAYADPLRLLTRLHLSRHEYEDAASTARRVTELAPEDSHFLYITSYCFKRAGVLEKAADYGERLRLRNPGEEKNLLSLAGIYYKMGIRDRSREFVERVLTSDPENRRALRLLERLQDD